MKPVLEAKSLSVGYNKKAILENLEFALYPGDFVCLMGSNGRGKTTLIKSLCGQLELHSGKILLNQVDVENLSALQISHIISVVLTDRLDLPHLSVRQFVALGRAPHTGFWGSLRTRDWQAVERALQDLQIEELAELQYNQLSDGQRQMVAVARAVAQETPIILLDEPTNYLDMPHKMALLSLLKRIAYERRTAILFSSHDWDVISEMCTLVWLTDLQGKLQIGMPEEIILWGDLSETFDFQHIHFSREMGKFIEPKTYSHYVKLVGEDSLVVQWTTHALAKEGIGISAEALIAVHCADRTWTFCLDGKSKMISSLYQLIWEIRGA